MRASQLLSTRGERGCRHNDGSILAEGIQWMIADSTMELCQCNLMELHAASKIDAQVVVRLAPPFLSGDVDERESVDSSAGS